MLTGLLPGLVCSRPCSVLPFSSSLVEQWLTLVVILGIGVGSFRGCRLVLRETAAGFSSGSREAWPGAGLGGKTYSEALRLACAISRFCSGVICRSGPWDGGVPNVGDCSSLLPSRPVGGPATGLLGFGGALTAHFCCCAHGCRGALRRLSTNLLSAASLFCC